jgi:hypothetical protein
MKDYEMRFKIEKSIADKAIAIARSKGYETLTQYLRAVVYNAVLSADIPKTRKP